MRTIAGPDVRCLALPEARVRSDVALVHREGEARPMVAAFERLAAGSVHAAHDRVTTP